MLSSQITHRWGKHLPDLTTVTRSGDGDQANQFSVSARPVRGRPSGVMRSAGGHLPFVSDAPTTLAGHEHRRPHPQRRPARRRARARCGCRAVLPRRPAELEEAAAASAGRRAARGRHRRVRPLAVPGQHRLDQQPHPDPVAQDGHPVRRVGRGHRREGPDRARRARHPGRGPGAGPRQLAQVLRAPGRGGRVPAADPDREHRGRRQRHGPQVRHAGPAVGRGRRVRRRLLPRHLPRARGRRGPGRHRRPGQGHHRPHRPGAPEQLARRVRLRPGPPREHRGLA